MNDLRNVHHDPAAGIYWAGRDVIECGLSGAITRVNVSLS